MPSPARFTQLFNLYADKQYEPAEREEFFSLIASGEYDELLEELVNARWEKGVPQWLRENEELKSEAAFQRIMDRVGVKQIMQQPIHFPWRRIAIAASLILAVATISYFLIIKQSSSDEQVVSTQSERFKNDVSPGKFKATLRLHDGSAIPLDNGKNGELAKEGNYLVTNNNGSLVYQYNGKSNKGELIRENTLTTGNGETYITTLSDGTKVWLNSASSLRYPVHFVGDTRVVTLTGEAYFEVAHDARHPFLVIAKDVEIRDLGTAFNVNAYNDEAVLKTTLIEGKAQVGSAGTWQIITPGQQAIVNSRGKPSLDQHPNIEQAVAWKTGKFIFKSADIKSLMRQLARWYDVAITYDDEINSRFVADISRNEPISKVLQLLELTGKVHFQIEGKKVTVLK